MARQRVIKQADESAEYLRGPKRLKVARAWMARPDLRRKALKWSGWILLALSAHWIVFSVLLQTRPFVVDQAAGGLRVEGLASVRAEEILPVFEQDFGRGLTSVDVSDRHRQLGEIQWVRSVRVARHWPNEVAVFIEEREPVAFLRLRQSGGIRMIDKEGAILEVRSFGDNSLPVVTGIDESMPEGERVRRIELFKSVFAAFARQGRALGEAVSEVDLSDVANAVVLARHGDRIVRLQMGDRHLEHRVEVFLRYIDAWRAEFGPIEAIDLRFEKQVAVKPAAAGKGKG